MKRKGPPRGSTVKAVPRIYLSSETGSIEIRQYSFTIRGSVEGAALAMAEDILKKKKENPQAQSHYYMAIDVFNRDNEIILGINSVPYDKEVWDTFKKNVEKICNNLTAFI
jgi:hypothetical protein